MKNECAIIKDILPLYIENIVSNETKEFVDEHLQDCTECKKLLDEMKAPATLPSDVGAVPLKSIKKQLKIQRIQTVVCVTIVVVVVLLNIFAYLTAPQYLPYKEGLVSVTESEEGTLICTISNEATGCRITQIMPTDDMDHVEYDISAWYSVWDRSIDQRTFAGNYTFEPVDGKPIFAYYIQNNGEEDILIYGEQPEELGRTTLPRLVLTYYFGICVIVAIILIALFMNFRKKHKNVEWLIKLIPLPISYIIAQLMVQGILFSTYSIQRDFALIIIITVLIYLAVFLCMSRYKQKKSQKD